MGVTVAAMGVPSRPSPTPFFRKGAIIHRPKLGGVVCALRGWEKESAQLIMPGLLPCAVAATQTYF